LSSVDERELHQFIENGISGAIVPPIKMVKRKEAETAGGFRTRMFVAEQKNKTQSHKIK